MVISINCMVGLSDELVGLSVEVVALTTISRTMQTGREWTIGFRGQTERQHGKGELRIN